MKKLELHWQIMIGMVAGILFSLALTQVDWGPQFIDNWIQPIGNIFVKFLKLIAIPLILASLVKGASVLKDISKYRNIGLRAIVIGSIQEIVV
ncbi:cation:dicarboxylate symporter family transporter [Polaribacter butkevichii]|uniref:cation:dicarboxylate symporter family transporter n=1 Tax=Polaribacter butkevichii TaxID=218490 RepID=UPI000CF3E3CA|nr:cation:dicarboxylase symporter family transporter [Polaribacter butkevichii]